MRGGEMRGSDTPTASKLEGGAKRAHKTVFFGIGRVYVVVGKHWLAVTWPKNFAQHGLCHEIHMRP